MLIFAVAACTNGVSPPSLLPRAVEKQDNVASRPPVPLSSAAASPALKRQIDELVEKVKAGDMVFTQTDRANGSLIAAGRNAPAGSEAWVVAQQAQSALEAARQDSTAALGEIEALLLERTQAAAGDPTVGGVADLSAAQAEASAIIGRQTRRLRELTR